MANTIAAGVYKGEWEARLQSRLNLPTTWKDIARVIVTNTRVLNVPYMSTTPAVQAGTRGTAYAYQDFALTNETLTVSTRYEVPIFIDEGDEAQTNFSTQMELAERQGNLLNERVETAVLADHATWTDFDNTKIGGGAGNITVSSANVDDIIRGLREEIGKANGDSLAAEKGIFIVWRIADRTKLESYAQANGFNLADRMLKTGIPTGVQGFEHGGVFHYFSNSHAAGHLFAGVRGQYTIGVLKATYGKITEVIHPAGSSGNNLAGTGVYSAVEIGLLAPNTKVAVLYDVLVA